MPSGGGGPWRRRRKGLPAAAAAAQGFARGRVKSHCLTIKTCSNVGGPCLTAHLKWTKALFSAVYVRVGKVRFTFLKVLERHLTRITRIKFSFSVVLTLS